jgi:uncharacterized membrane protein YqjE
LVLGRIVLFWLVLTLVDDTRTRWSSLISLSNLYVSAAIMTMILLRDSDSPEALEAGEEAQAESDLGTVEKAKEFPAESGKPETLSMDTERR